MRLLPPILHRGTSPAVGPKSRPGSHSSAVGPPAPTEITRVIAGAALVRDHPATLGAAMNKQVTRAGAGAEVDDVSLPSGRVFCTDSIPFTTLALVSFASLRAMIWPFQVETQRK